MQYWLERLGELNPLVESLPLELVTLLVVCVSLVVFLSKHIFKLVLGIARFGVIAALVLFALSYASKIEVPQLEKTEQSSELEAQASGLVVVAKMQIGQSLVDLGERIKPVD